MSDNLTKAFKMGNFSPSPTIAADIGKILSKIKKMKEKNSYGRNKGV